jgi:colanic acid/amylovoran biosynthesis glycosyltransferase
MRILYMVGAFPTLSQTFILDQVTAMIDRGHEVLVYAQRYDESVGDPGCAAAYSLRPRTRIPPCQDPGWIARGRRGLALAATLGWRSPRRVLRCLDVVRHGRSAASLELLFAASPLIPERPFDVIHCHFGTNGLLAHQLQALGVLRGRIITTFHGYDVNVLPGQLGDRLYDELFRAGTVLTVNSEFLRQRLTGLGANPAQIVKLPPGVNPAAFPFRQRTPEADGSVRLITVGRLEEVKGVEYAIRAVRALLPRFPRLRYQVVGAGSLREPLIALAEDLGVSAHVDFAGARSHEHIAEMLDAAHLFVYSGVVGQDGAEEAHGVALLEAQAAGLPVVASRLGGVPESVPDGCAGVLVAPGDVEALASALAHLIERPELWPGMGAAGRRNVECNYDQRLLNDWLAELYERVAMPRRAS